MISRTEQTLVIPNLPEACRGLRVAHLTDMHRCHLTSDAVLHRAVALTLEARPDLILLTGDFITEDKADIGPCAHILAPLRARLGVYAVLGNHDYSTEPRGVLCALEDLGIRFLINDHVRLEGGFPLVGLDDEYYGRPNVARAFHGISPDEPALVMAHNPVTVERLTERACVVFSGHTHGGQVCVPIITARKLRRIGAKHYRSGWYTEGKARVYVNRGLGRVGLPIRFRCPPEIALFTLDKGSSE